MQDLIHDFINSLNRRPTTKETYRKALMEYSKWLGNTSPIGLNSNDIQRYKDFISSKNLSTSSISAYLTAVRRLYDYLENTGKIKENPAKKVKGGARPERHSTKPICQGDLKRLFDSIDTSASLGLRDSVILNLMLRCGLSEIEIVRADVGDIKTRRNETIIYVQGKNKDRKDEYVVIPGEIAKEIENYLGERESSEDNEPLFWGVGNRARKERITTRAIRARISQYFEKLGLNKKGITPYSLRHTAALLAIESGASVADVMKMLRVKTVDTALVYFEEAKELKKSN
ncbi:MAG: tyrosine-type recombinase/integrase [Candidatus Korarchaeota archaeon]|nr:tyrosine-type recombinase/integrase [Candidatus Korarchaeota archaeon]